MTQQSHPLISWIVPVYNTARYLPQCLESVIGQTYRHWELLLMDDGSTDASPTLCDRYAEQDSRIRVVHKPNTGKPDTLNQAIALSRGDYVGIIDSDDWIAPTLSEVLLQAMRDSGKDAAGCGYLNEFVGETVQDPVCAQRQPCTAAEVIAQLYDRRLYGYLHGRLYKRTLLVDPVPPLRRYEDFAVLFRWLGRGNGMVLCPECLYHYRQRQSSIMNSSHDHMFGYVPLLEECYHYLRDHQMMTEEQARATAVKNMVRIAKSIARETRGAETDARLKAISDTLRRIAPPHPRSSTFRSKCGTQSPAPSNFSIKLQLRLWLLTHHRALFKAATRLTNIFIIHQHRQKTKHYFM